MRAVAILAVFNEERFIAACLSHLLRQGLEVYLIDNSSTDRTVSIAEKYLGRGLIGIESFPRHGMYSWRPLLERKEELAEKLEADWFMHADADEFRLPPPFLQSLAQAFEQVEAEGYNAVNFVEFVFTPTQESPDHDHAEFERTMRWYYPFVPSPTPQRLNAWKRQAQRVELAWSGGHQVRFPDLRQYPQSFPMRHYLFLSAQHALDKYSSRGYDPAEVKAGWHRARASLKSAPIVLPAERELRQYKADDQLDASNPRHRHYLFDFSADIPHC